MNREIEARLLLVSLPGVGPARARWLLGEREPSAVIDVLRTGRLPVGIGQAPPGVTTRLVTDWSKALRELDVGSLLETHRSLGIALLAPGEAHWPFADDPEPPVLLFYRGALDLLQSAGCIAVVGTRRCTTVGRTVSYQLGRELAMAGFTVLSGLALGVDGAAHRGALDRGGSVIGVVGSGLDVVYPGGNRELWNEVATRGLLLSEAPAGARPERWRFPARNRLIAGLSDGVVIVESHGRGGALLTVDEAVDRGKPVFAVPGSVLSPASDGTNQLLVDGATPVRNATDVLGHFGLTAIPETSGSVDAMPITDLESVVLSEIATGPVHIDVLVHASGRSTVDVLAAVQALVAAGRVELDGSTVSRSHESP